MDKRKGNEKGKQLLWKYAGMGTQILLSLGMAAFAGYHADKWIGWQFPLLVWLAPLVFLVVLFLKIVKDTSGKE